MFTVIGIIILLILAALAVFVATRPDRLIVERSAEISAPAAVVFPLINDFHEWVHWSPWEKRDPDMKKTFEGPAAGPGAVYAWAGNKHVGEGRMTLLENKQDALVVIKLEFFKPFPGVNETRFTLTPASAGTRVHWRMEGANTLMGKVISLFLNMDRMIGTDFENGLAAINLTAQERVRQVGAAH